MTRVAAIIVMLVLLAASTIYFVRSREVEPPKSITGSASTVGAGAPVPVTVAEARTHTSRENVVLAGNLRSGQQADITTTYTGRIQAVIATEGQPVRRGQVLVRLDTTLGQDQVAGAQAAVAAAQAQYRKAVDGKRARRIELDSQVSQAESGLKTALVRLRQAQLGERLNRASAASDADRAQAAVRQAEAGVRQADTALAQANETASRLKFLYDHGGVSLADLQGAETQASITKAQRDAAVAGLDQAKAAANPASTAAPLRNEVSKADIEAARAGVDQARTGVRDAIRARDEALRIADHDISAAAAQVRQAQAGERQATGAVGSGTLTSPLDGVATNVVAHPGEVVQPGMPLMTIVSTSSVYFEAAAPARYADRLRTGLLATITLSTFPDHPFDGVVTDVLPVAGIEGNSVPLHIRIVSGGIRLTPGAAGSAEVELASVPNALEVPLDAVRSEGNVPFVYVVRDGKAERHNLVLGGTEGQYARVLSGISSGDVVVLTGPSALQSGTAVTVVGR